MKQNLKPILSWAAVIVVIYLLLAFLTGTGMLGAYYIQIMMGVGISIIMAMGTNLVLGFTGQFPLGQAGFMAIGAYATAIITGYNDTYAGFYLSMLVGVLIAGVIAVIVGFPTLRLKGDYLAIATLGVAEIIRIAIVNGGELTNGAAGLTDILQYTSWPVVYAFVVVIAILMLNFLRSSIGHEVISVREDEIAAESMGVNTTKIKVMTFAFAAMTASIAGSLYVGYIGTVVPKDFTIMKSIDYLIIAVLGGLGSMTGTIVAAIVLGILNMYLQNFSDLRMVIYSLALILVMVFRPGGLLGTRELKLSTKNFGGLTAVGDVTLELNEGELVGLIGPNGAGKTTLFNLLTGVYEPSEGTITLDGNLLNGKKPYHIAALGLSRTFQNIRLFKEMTVLDNVLVGLANSHKQNIVASLLRLPSYYSSEKELRQKALDLLAIFDLDGEADTLAKNLPYGQQRRLEIVRALATEPKILFLDEPAAGMNPQETAELTQLIRQIKEEFNITIMLIEHDMSLVMEVTERIYVLEYGRVIAHGTPDEIKNDKRVIEAYLGGEA